jgi:hypothetical protein
VAQAVEPDYVKLIVGALSAYPEAFERAMQALRGLYGPIDVESPPIAFDFTKYYEKEMGPGLTRRFFAFERFVDPALLPDVKLSTNRLEQEIAAALGGPVPRPINLDPGYVTPAKLVLASVKDFSHRVYLRDGIYAEVTLHFQKGGTVRSWPWTFSDYETSPEYHAFLLEARQKCLSQLKELRITKGQAGA